MVTAGLGLKFRSGGFTAAQKTPKHYCPNTQVQPQRKDKPLDLAHAMQEEQGLLEKQGNKTKPTTFSATWNKPCSSACVSPSLISSSVMQSQLPQEPEDVFLGATSPEIEASPEEAANRHRGATCRLSCGCRS